jgi:hypothetical protein
MFGLLKLAPKRVTVVTVSRMPAGVKQDQTESGA